MTSYLNVEMVSSEEFQEIPSLFIRSFNQLLFGVY